jgi:hypothetical protein
MVGGRGRQERSSCCRPQSSAPSSWFHLILNKADPRRQQELPYPDMSPSRHCNLSSCIHCMAFYVGLYLCSQLIWCACKEYGILPMGLCLLPFPPTFSFLQLDSGNVIGPSWGRGWGSRGKHRIVKEGCPRQQRSHEGHPTSQGLFQTVLGPQEGAFPSEASGRRAGVKLDPQRRVGGG